MLTGKELMGLDGKNVRIVTTYGDVLEGACVYESEEFLECEWGFDEEGLHIADFIVLRSQIESAEVWDIESEAGPLRAAEIEQKLIFSLRRSFSDHLKRWEDNEVPDKYDHNAFECFGQPTREEFSLALAYQKERGDNFIKLESREPLADSFGLTEKVVLTMVLEEQPECGTVSEAVAAVREAHDAAPAGLEIRKPVYRDLQALELRHYSGVYGEDFCRRNIDELYEYLGFRGAYIGDRLVGAYHYFSSGDATIIDGLLVDSDLRGRGIGKALICDAARLAAEAAGAVGAADQGRAEAAGAACQGRAEAAGARAPWVLALHADRDDRPREMYEKMGFTAVDTLYEYLCSDISAIV